MNIQTSDLDQIKELLANSFENGPLNKLDMEAMHEAFHPDFNILSINGDNLNNLPLQTWINAIEKYKSSPESINSGVRNVQVKYKLIDITSKAAMVKTELIREDQLISTDYISLLKFSDGWKIVSKISNEHINNPFNL